jgi:hypothetical protein
MDELVNADLSGHPNKVDTSNPNNLLVKQESTLVTNALFHFFDTESRVNTDNFNYSEALRGEAERQSKLAERKVDISTYASYALFGIGWFLGLIGKLLKLPVLGGAATE